MTTERLKEVAGHKEILALVTQIIAYTVVVNCMFVCLQFKAWLPGCVKLGVGAS